MTLRVMLISPAGRRKTKAGLGCDIFHNITIAGKSPGSPELLILPSG